MSVNPFEYLHELEEKEPFQLQMQSNEEDLYAVKQKNFILLGNKEIQYVLQIHEETGKVTLLHFGEKVSTLNPRPGYQDDSMGGDEYSSIYSDYPIYGDGDDREPALKLCSSETGIRTFDFRYQGYEIVSGKNGLLKSGLPCTYIEHENEARSMIVKLRDENIGLDLHLHYTIFRDFNAIARHTEIINNGNQTIIIERLSSWSVDFAPSSYENGYNFLQLQGAWARECEEVWNKVDHGKYVIADAEGSRVLRANPFVALANGPVSEDSGEVFGFSHVYSGSFQSVVQVNQWGLLRLNMGMHPDLFQWKLNPGESVESPESVAVYSSKGLGEMSRHFHSLYRTRLARGEWRDKMRPILINTWEPFGFSFTHSSLLDLAKSAQGTGVDLFVLDDGWFGARNSDKAGLGDWYPNKEKLPNGLHGLAKDVNSLGLDFGLWIEPESISFDSHLYRTHPEWVVQVPGRRPIEMRNQLLLDLTSSDVQDYLIETFTNILNCANIKYVKWDHNRFISNPYSLSLSRDRQCEFHHRYMLGFYRVAASLTSRFPSILFEGCSSGGGRFDPGTLAFFPQVWASDNTDVEERVKIQHSLSMVYPLSMVGAHVSTSPNQQVGRITDWGSRTAVAHFGTFGYELDMRYEPKNQVSIDSNVHVTIRHLIHEGFFYRLRNPNKSNLAAWSCVSKDNSREAVVFVYQRHQHTREIIPSFLLKGLDSKKNYFVVEIPKGSCKRICSGNELMGRGFTTTFSRDFEGQLFYLCEVDYFKKRWSKVN